MYIYVKIHVHIHIYAYIYYYMYIYEYALHHPELIFSFLFSYTAAFSRIRKSVVSSAFQSKSFFPCVVVGPNGHTFISVYFSCARARAQPLLIEESRCIGYTLTSWPLSLQKLEA